MGRIVAFRVVLASILAALLVCPYAIAQETPPPAEQDRARANPVESQPPSGEEELPFVPPPGVVTELPYVRWTRHTGKPEETAALVRVQHNGTTRTATGLVLRCDGFILVPLWVTEALKERASLSVSVTEAEGETLTAPIPVHSRTHHTSTRPLYGILKVTGYHLRSLPMLAPGNIAPGTSVRLVTAEQGKDPWQCQATSVPAVVGSLGEKRDLWTLKARLGESAPISESAPVGAIVVDEESGAALGMVTRGGETPVFSSFLFFHDVSKDMGLVPNREVMAERKKRPQHLSPEELGRLKPGGAENGVAWVPGGPVRLSGKVAADYRRSYRTDIACTPGFFAHANLVTNEEYREWLRKQRTPRRPPGWERPDELAVPRRHPRFPVVLVPQEDAMAYAADHNARLLTDVEWCRAALCRDTEWVAPILTTWAMAVGNMQHLMQERVRAMRRAVEAKKAAKGSSEEFQAYVEVLTRPSIKDHTVSLLMEVQNMTRVMGDAYPTLLTPIGYRKDDASIFGVRDVVMNAAEMVQGRSGEVQQNLAPKALPSPSDPMLALIRFTRINDLTRTTDTYALTVGEAQQALRNPDLDIEDRIFLTYYAIMASLGVRRTEGTLMFPFVVGPGKSDARKIYDALTVESLAIYPPGFRLAQ